MVAKCKVCGRPLKNPASIAAGMGKICAQKSGALITEKVRPGEQRLIFGNTPKASYIYEVEDDIISIIDLDGEKTLTNDMEKVIHEIETEENIDATQYKIMYCDSQGIWDGVTYHNKSHVSFYSIGAKNRFDAITILNSK